MNYHIIHKDDMLNGSGLRVVLFLSGCSHHCFNCQNPQTWDDKNGKEFDITAIDEIKKELTKDYISGITLSGGDPLYKNNLSEVYMFLKDIKSCFPNKSIWLYSGYTWEQIYPHIHTDELNIEREYRQMILSLCDVFVDGEYVEALSDVNYPWAGSKNQRIIDVQKSIDCDCLVLWQDNN